MPQTQNPYGYVSGNPVLYTDPSGKLIGAILLGIGIGAALGAAIGAGTEVVPKAVNNISNGDPVFQDVNWEEAGKRAAVGAVGGAVAGGVGVAVTAALGAATAAVPAAIGGGMVGDALGGQAAIATDNVLNGRPITENLGRPEDIARDAALGGLTAGLGEIVFGGGLVDDALPSSGACSFSEDTPVETRDGEKPINEIDEGDYVLAYNEETGETGYYPVSAVWAHVDPVTITLIIDGEVIETTPEHPFYTAEGEWVPAGELKVGDEVRQADGSTGVVESIEWIAEDQTMYNFTVDVAHTYFVGTGQWLVHNACTPGEGWSYGSLKDKSIGDGLDLHHMPNKRLPYMTPDQGYAMAITPEEHLRTRTYGRRAITVNNLETHLNFRQKLALDIMDMRNITQVTRGTRTFYNEGLLRAIRYYEFAFPGHMLGLYK